MVQGRVLRGDLTSAECGQQGNSEERSFIGVQQEGFLFIKKELTLSRKGRKRKAAWPGRYLRQKVKVRGKRKDELTDNIF